ncbi:MAG: hypothetical protein KBD55_00770 [Candidatus Pacebacteria bacterium]|nr:hypothetical protein [Candidatus Paceibacterota bacterium]
MNLKDKLKEIGLDTDNSIVIGSGILEVLGIRKSADIDVVVTEKKFTELSKNLRFKRGEKEDVLTDGVFEIGPNWKPLGESFNLEQVLDKTTVIDGVRYNSLEFLLIVKKQWLKEGDKKPKTAQDVVLIEEYLRNK